MSNKHDIDVSYSLEMQLSRSIDKMRENVTRSHRLRQEIKRLRRVRRQIEKVPDEVREWFDEVGDLDDEEE